MADEHKLPLKQLYEELDSSPDGLSMSQVEAASRIYGPNILDSKRKDSLIVKFLHQFTNFFAILLLAGSALAFLAEYLQPDQGNIYIAIALVGVVFLNAVFTFLQQYQSEKIMESFRKMMPEKVNVIRESSVVEILSKEVVPGDILLLKEGDKVPADARLIEENSLKVDNSSITGESEPQLRKLMCTHKDILESRNMVFSGTLVQSGNGKALVYGTGMNTQIGRILKLTNETREVDTPLHKELRHFIKIISTIAIVLGVSFFFVSLLVGKQLFGSLIFAIGIIVANVPEGLLPTVTFCLTIASKRMAKKNALVKNLESVETLGSTTVICTDKTGTITENRMSVSSLYIDLEERSAYDKKVQKMKSFSKLLDTMVLCNNSRVEDKDFLGDPTETALMRYCSDRTKISGLLKKHKRLHESPFDSKTKRMITTNRTGRSMTAYLKGAPEVVIRKCDSVLVGGKVSRLTDKRRKEIMKSYELFASRGERVLAFASKVTNTEKAKEDCFTFIGLAGLLDPPRKEVADALAKCRTAGIRVIMITGDFSLTAEAIARKVGMIRERSYVVTGDRLAKMDDEELKAALKKEGVLFARTNPMQKLRIVKALQSMGEVVTVTGDGVNDAPALKNADMGVAMGMIGTEVARESSDMVLLDDNFATIVNAVEEGRTIFENIKKFIAYILTSNIPEILPFIAFVLLQIPLPLSVILILSIDLGTDILPAIGMGTEKPESDVMKKSPRSRKERLLSKNLLFMSYGIVGMIQAAAGFFSYFFVLYRGGWTWGMDLAMTDPLYLKAVSAFFASIIICQIADVLICRTRRQSIFKVGILSNRIVNIGILTELALLYLIVFVANGFFGTHPLTLLELSLSIPFALVILFGDELRKLLVRRDNSFVKKYLTW